jgi:hypothetical protein
MTKFKKQFKILENGKYHVEITHADLVEGGEKLLPSGETKLTEDSVQIELTVKEGPYKGMMMTKILSLGSKSDIFTEEWFSGLTGMSTQELMKDENEFDTDNFIGMLLTVNYYKKDTNSFPIIDLLDINRNPTKSATVADLLANAPKKEKEKKK